MLISLLLYYFSYCTYYSIYTHSVRSVLVLCNGTVRVRTAAVVRRYTVLVHYCTAETNRTPHNAHHLPSSQSVRFILPPQKDFSPRPSQSMGAAFPECRLDWVPFPFMERVDFHSNPWNRQSVSSSAVGPAGVRWLPLPAVDQFPSFHRQCRPWPSKQCWRHVAAASDKQSTYSLHFISVANLSVMLHTKKKALCKLSLSMYLMYIQKWSFYKTLPRRTHEKRLTFLKLLPFRPKASTNLLLLS